MKRKTLIKSSIRVRLKRKLLKNIILLIATKVEIYAVLPWEKKVSNLAPEKYFKSSRRTRGT